MEKLGILLLDPPQYHIGSDASAHSRFLGILQRWMQKRGVQLPGTEIRGAGIAVESILVALLGNAEYDTSAVYLPGPAIFQWKKWYKHLIESATVPDRPCSVHSLERVALQGTLADTPSLIFDPAGATATALRMRASCGLKSVPPICSLQLTLSVQVSLERHYPVVLSLPTYPCDALICASHAARRAVVNLIDQSRSQLSARERDSCRYDGAIEIIPLCVDTERFSPGNQREARKRLRIRHDEFICLYLGYLSPEKADILSLMSVFASLTHRFMARHIRVVLAGTGDMRYIAEIRRCAQRCGVRLTVLGMVTPLVKPDLYRAADVFFSPANCLTESFGLSPVEAMSCGVPQIVTDWDGYRDTVKHNVTGFLVPTAWYDVGDGRDLAALFPGSGFDNAIVAQEVVSSHKEWYSAFSAILENPTLRARMSHDSRIHAMNSFSHRVVSNLYENLWKEQQRVARGIRPSVGADGIGAPHFYASFAHYATKSEGKYLRVMRDGVGPFRDIRFEIASRASCAGFIDSDLAFEIYDSLTASLQSAGEISSKLRSTKNSNEPFEESRVNRHLAWLLKHGFADSDSFSEAIGE